MNYDDIIQNVTNWDEFPIPVDLTGMELSLIGGIAYKTIIRRVKFCVKIAKIQNRYDFKRILQNLKLMNQY